MTNGYTDADTPSNKSGMNRSGGSVLRIIRNPAKLLGSAPPGSQLAGRSESHDFTTSHLLRAGVRAVPRGVRRDTGGGLPPAG